MRRKEERSAFRTQSKVHVGPASRSPLTSCSIIRRIRITESIRRNRGERGEFKKRDDDNVDGVSLHCHFLNLSDLTKTSSDVNKTKFLRPRPK